jgi:intracellular sulfur oxidation DsrE/DsrF family protein
MAATTRPRQFVMNFLEEVVMKVSKFTGIALSLLIAFSGSMQAATLAIPNAEAAKPVPGAKELPDPNMTYKVVFDLATAAPKVEDVNPGLTGVARFVNTLSKYGVPAEHRKIAVVFHRDATEVILNNETFQARNHGQDNPNIALIREMKKAGVDFRVCGQAVLAHKIDPKTIQPEIELDLWALTTIVNLELRGYVHVGQ